MVESHFLISYISWHYTSAFLEIFSIWRNFLVFFYNLFSIPLLLKTLFSPWKRLDENKPSILNFEDFFSVIIVNTLMRLIGAVMRIFVIFTGVLTLIFSFIVGFLFVLFWPLLPFIALFTLVSGVYFLFLS